MLNRNARLCIKSPLPGREGVSCSGEDNDQFTTFLVPFDPCGRSPCFRDSLVSLQEIGGCGGRVPRVPVSDLYGYIVSYWPRDGGFDLLVLIVHGHAAEGREGEGGTFLFHNHVV